MSARQVLFNDRATQCDLKKKKGKKSNGSAHNKTDQYSNYLLQLPGDLSQSSNTKRLKQEKLNRVISAVSSDLRDSPWSPPHPTGPALLITCLALERHLKKKNQSLHVSVYFCVGENSNQFSGCLHSCGFASDSILAGLKVALLMCATLITASKNDGDLSSAFAGVEAMKQREAEIQKIELIVLKWDWQKWWFILQTQFHKISLGLCSSSNSNYSYRYQKAVRWLMDLTVHVM